MPHRPSLTLAPRRCAARTTRRRGSRLVQWALAWLLLSLVAVPLVGRLHQVAHGGALDRAHANQASAVLAHGYGVRPPVPAHAHAQAPVQAHTHSQAPVFAHASTSPVGGHWLLRLLAVHAPADCLLLDQLALGDTLQGATLALPDAAPVRAQPCAGAQRTAAASAAPFQARGPPSA